MCEIKWYINNYINMSNISYFVKVRTKIIIGSDHGGYILKEYIKKNK